MSSFNSYRLKAELQTFSEEESMAQEMVSACWLHPDLRKSLAALHGGVTTFIKRYERAGKITDVSFDLLSPEALKVVISFLRDRCESVLRKRTVLEIVGLLDSAAVRWLDPAYGPRQKAVGLIADITGFSPEMVAHAIDEEQSSSRGPHLLQALANELGDPAFLDGFQPSERLGGFSYALGPGLLGAIFSSNIPALPHLEVMRAFLTKSACLGRVSAGEPVFLAQYAETLYELDPELASCLAVIYWERGDDERESIFLSEIDYLVAYGGDEQMNRLLKVKPPALEATLHGHGVGFTYLARGALDRQNLDELAHKVSYDFTIFDGHACLCPQICLVETGGEVSPREFALACARHMGQWAKDLPPRRFDLSEAAARYRMRELYLMRESPADDLEVIAAPDDHSYLVVIEPLERFEPSPLDRFFRIAPISGFADVERLIRPLKDYLQCAAVAFGTEENGESQSLKRKLASWGVSRIVPPGIVGRPSMMWRHDGTPCLGKMIRWCDIELVSPEVLLTLQRKT
jgi:Acyl-CoA reductase (LuxC)